MTDDNGAKPDKNPADKPVDSNNADKSNADKRNAADKTGDKPTLGPPTTGPVTEPPTNPKPLTEAAQEGAVLPSEQRQPEPVEIARRKGMFGSSLGNDTSGYGGLERPIIFPGATPRPYGGWFDQLADLVPHHVVSTDVPEVVKGRALVVERLDMFPVECVARGYLTGSGLKEYQESGTVCGIELPEGLEIGRAHV